MLFVVTQRVVVNASEGEIVDINKGAGYSSSDYYEMAQKLVEKYPNILLLEVLGKSVDNKPIYAIIMTENVAGSVKRDDFNVFRMHYFVEAGMHARETVNPAIVLKMIEDYAIDYVNDKHIAGFNVKQELTSSVIHFIPLLNPDGHDLSKFGINSVKTAEGKKIINSISDKKYSEWKANLRGVDINRNFPDRYLDKKTKQWVEKWQKYPSSLMSYVPSGSYYSGPYAGSEPETKLYMDYMLKYDFRNKITYHSRGEILYFDWSYAPEGYSTKAKVLADLTYKLNGYAIQYNRTGPGAGKGSGFGSAYFAANTLKPTVTLETVPSGTPTPTPQKYFKAAYNQTYLLPLHFVQAGKKEGYHKYRLYVEDKYIRDYFDYDYAMAHAKELGGKVLTGVGKPEMFLIEYITREKALTELISKYYDLTNLTVNALDTFKDTNSIIPTFSRNIGVLSKSDKFRPGDNITSYEVATIIYNIHKEKGIELTKTQEHMNQELKYSYPKWAKEAIQYVTYHEIMPEYSFRQELFDNVILKIINY